MTELCGKNRSRYDVLMIKDDEVAYFRARPRYEYHSDSFNLFNVALYSEKYTFNVPKFNGLPDSSEIAYTYSVSSFIL